MDDGYNLNDYVQTKEFEQEMMRMYQNALKQSLLEKRYYKLIDALEETVNFWSYGRNAAMAPIHGSYVPVRYTIMPKPDMRAKEAELDYRYNLSKLGPVEYANPLKAYKMSPEWKDHDWSGLRMYQTRFKFVKRRRLSRTKFSTLDKTNYMPADTQINNLSGGATNPQPSYLSSLFGGMGVTCSPYNPMH